jgi:uncharacterized protein (TIGR02588 family)
MAHQDQRQDSGSDQQEEGSEAMREEAPPLSEWMVAAVGLVLLVFSLGYLTFQAFTSPHTAPVPVVELLGIDQQGNRFLARVRVSNRGPTTAERLSVAGQLKRQGEVVEESATEFEFLPGGSSREAGLFFSRDPRAMQLELFARSYQKP